MTAGKIATFLVCTAAIVAFATSKHGVAQSATTATGTVTTTANGTERDGVQYTVNGTPELMDIALPAHPLVTPTPIVVCIHGGSWTYGTRADMQGALTMLQAEGVASCTIDYRLAPSAQFPAQIQDCKCAVRYLRAHAAELNINPNKIGVLGLSAGAHLGLLLGLAPNVVKFEGTGGWQNEPSNVTSVIDLEGPTDLTAALNLSTISSDNRKLGEELFGAPLEADRQSIIDASPITYVKAGETPLLIIQGEADTLVPIAQSRELYAKMKATGNDVAFIPMPGVGHGALQQFATPDNIAAVNQFLARTLN